MRNLNDWQINAQAQALTVASATGNSGSGIMQDVQIMQKQDVFSQTVVVASSADTADYLPIEPDLIDGQFDEIRNDGEINAVKLGQLNTVETMQVVMKNLSKHDFGPLVVEPIDTVNKLSDELKNTVLPITTMLVANIFQAGQLTSSQVQTADDTIKAAQQLQRFGTKNVMITNVANNNKVQDLVLLEGQEPMWLPYAKFDKTVTGVNSVISASITADIAKGTDLKTAIENAHQFAQNTKIDL